jgi:hypothetical protein
MIHRGRKNQYDMIEPVVLRPEFKPLRRQPPDHLGEPERQIWEHVFADYELSNHTAVDVLVTALRPTSGPARPVRPLGARACSSLVGTGSRSHTPCWQSNATLGRRGWRGSRRSG